MYDMGLDAYRFSIAWPRLIPGRHNHINKVVLNIFRTFLTGSFNWIRWKRRDQPQGLGILQQSDRRIDNAR